MRNQNPLKQAISWYFIVGAIAASAGTYLSINMAKLYLVDHSSGYEVFYPYLIMVYGVVPAGVFMGWLVIRRRVPRDRWVAILAALLMFAAIYGVATEDWKIMLPAIVLAWIIAFVVWSFASIHMAARIAISSVLITLTYLSLAHFSGSINASLDNFNTRSENRDLGFKVYFPSVLPDGFENNEGSVDHYSSPKSYYFDFRSDKLGTINVDEYTYDAKKFRPTDDCGYNHNGLVPCEINSSMSTGEPIYSGISPIGQHSVYVKLGSTLIVIYSERVPERELFRIAQGLRPKS